MDSPNTQQQLQSITGVMHPYLDSSGLLYGQPIQTTATMQPPTQQLASMNLTQQNPNANPAQQQQQQQYQQQQQQQQQQQHQQQQLAASSLQQLAAACSS